MAVHVASFIPGTGALAPSLVGGAIWQSVHRRQGNAQQLGTDSEIRRLCSLVIDLEADFVVFLDEVDHAAGAGETFHFTYRQHAGPAKSRYDLRQARPFRGIDEENVAISRLSQSAKLFEDDYTVIDLLVTNRPLEVAAEGIATEGADDKRRSGFDKGVGRPFDKLCKIEKERGLQLVLRGPGILRPAADDGQQQAQAQAKHLSRATQHEQLKDPPKLGAFQSNPVHPLQSVAP